MKKTFRILLIAWMMALAGLISACGGPPSTTAAAGGRPNVLAAESFLADIAQNVAGERLNVAALIPKGLDPHAFEPTPQDVVLVSMSQVLIINGGGLEEWLNKVLENADGERRLIVASDGLAVRTPKEGEVSDHPGEGDPHFWLDPNNVIQYVNNMRDGLTAADPAGKDTYSQNAAAYIEQLQELDGWIRAQVAQVPVERRLLVTNHESLGYFAERYGFTLVGAIIPSVSTSASPSAQELAGLMTQMKETGAPAIFLETGSNSQLADQVASETRVKVVSGLLTHSVIAPDGSTLTYLEMMRFNVGLIVGALQ